MDAMSKRTISTTLRGPVNNLTTALMNVIGGMSEETMSGPDLISSLTGMDPEDLESLEEELEKDPIAKLRFLQDCIQNTIDVLEAH